MRITAGESFNSGDVHWWTKNTLFLFIAKETLHPWLIVQFGQLLDPEVRQVDGSVKFVPAIAIAIMQWVNT